MFLPYSQKIEKFLLQILGAEGNAGSGRSTAHSSKFKKPLNLFETSNFDLHFLHVDSCRHRAHLRDVNIRFSTRKQHRTSTTNLRIDQTNRQQSVIGILKRQVDRN